MELRQQDLRVAAASGLISAQQADSLWQFLSDRNQDTPGFRVTHILYYLGGMIAIGAMGLFMTLGWERLGGGGLLAIALAYAAAGLALTEYFLKRRLPIPAGIMAAFVVALTPLAVYGLQTLLGWWPPGEIYRDYHRLVDWHWRWIFMEFATLASGAVLLARYRLPFLVMPVAVTLWYISMDLALFVFGLEDPDWQVRQIVSLWGGLLTLLLAFWVDIRTRHTQDYAFWLYLAGALAFWGSLSSMHSDSELSKFLYLCINLLMIAVGAALSRRVFAVLGGIGAAGYLGHLAYSVFRDSLVFPLLLTLIGLGVIYLGILWQRHEAELSARLRHFLPGPLRELIEQRQ